MSRLPGALLLALLLIGCGSKSAPDGVLRIMVVPKGTSHEFWKSIHAGAVKAERELKGVAITFQGPQREDDREDQVRLVENAISTGVDAIVLAPLDDRALARPVKDAMRAGVPVVIIDSGLEGEIGRDFISFVATDNLEGGRLAGRTLVELLGGKGPVLVLRYQEGSASTRQREQGFVEVVRDHPGIELVDPERYAGATREKAQEAAENLLSAYPDVAGIFCSNESATFGMLLALRGRSAAGRVKFVGFDASPGLVEALSRGEIDGLLVQDPMLMGYLGVKTAVAHVRGETVAPLQDTGVRVVTRTNMNEPDIAALLAPPLEEYLGR